MLAAFLKRTCVNRVEDVEDGHQEEENPQLPVRLQAQIHKYGKTLRIQWKAPLGAPWSYPRAWRRGGEEGAHAVHKGAWRVLCLSARRLFWAWIPTCAGSDAIRKQFNSRDAAGA